MKRIALLVSLIVSAPVGAQVSHGGQPIGWGQPLAHQLAVPEVTLDPMDNGVLVATEVSDVRGGVKYGTQRFFTADVPVQGQWLATDDDRRVCRLVLRSPGAVMISVQFSQFDLVPEAMVYLYNEDRSYFIGGFTEQNEQATGDMATAVIPGEAVVIELVEPEPSIGTSTLLVGSITHGYRDIFDFRGRGFLRDYYPGYSSSPCHINTICPSASAWQSEKRSVAMFLRPDGNGCTGHLINNTQTPGVPYFYAANHCYVPTESQWVFYFNYESPACVGDTGITHQTVSGSTMKASEYYDDVLLLQLNNAPPTAYNPYYAGWNRGTAAPTSSVAMMHPLYDVKKIAFENNTATSYTVLPFVGATQSVNCWKVFWNSGLAEAVGSGSGLFDQNHRIVGHMYDGAQTCATATSVFTGFAKFNAEWDGANASTRLRDWLDPPNTATTLDGYDAGGAPVPTILVRARILLEGPFDGTSNMNGTLRADGLVPLAEPYTALGYTHVNGGGGETTTASVLSGSGTNSIVDWVVVELRDKNNPATVLATRAALVQRDGDVVSPANGTGDVAFVMPVDDYYIAVRHRNHLGIMSQNAQALSTTATLKDFSTGAIPTYGGTAATKLIGTRRCLYAGDVTMNGEVKYTGAGNDRDPVLTRIGGVVPTSTTTGYWIEDLNMDGAVKYTGSGNDRDIILVNIGGTVPTNTLVDQIP